MHPNRHSSVPEVGNPELQALPFNRASRLRIRSFGQSNNRPASVRHTNASHRRHPATLKTQVVWRMSMGLDLAALLNLLTFLGYPTPRLVLLLPTRYPINNAWHAQVHNRYP